MNEDKLENEGDEPMVEPTAEEKEQAKKTLKFLYIAMAIGVLLPLVLLFVFKGIGWS